MKHIKRKCKTCLGQQFEHIMYMRICDQGYFMNLKA